MSAVPARRSSMAPAVMEAEPEVANGAKSRRSGHAYGLPTQRDRLVAAMGELTAEVGPSTVGVHHVCQRAGVSRRTFYDIYADRDACFLDALGEAQSRLVAACGRRGRRRRAPSGRTAWSRRPGLSLPRSAPIGSSATSASSLRSPPARTRWRCGARRWTRSPSCSARHRRSMCPPTSCWPRRWAASGSCCATSSPTTSPSTR